MFNQIPYGMGGPFLSSAASKTSFLSKINWSTLLSNTQKTLNVVNQAIPLYYQVKPIFGNIKTISKIGKELGNINKNNQNTLYTSNSQTDIKKEYNTQSYPQPTFFL